MQERADAVGEAGRSDGKRIPSVSVTARDKGKRGQCTCTCRERERAASAVEGWVVTVQKTSPNTSGSQICVALCGRRICFCIIMKPSNPSATTAAEDMRPRPRSERTPNIPSAMDIGTAQKMSDSRVVGVVTQASTVLGNA